MAYLDPNEAVPCHAESAARERFDRKREAPRLFRFRSPATERAIGADAAPRTSYARIRSDCERRTGA